MRASARCAVPLLIPSLALMSAQEQPCARRLALPAAGMQHQILGPLNRNGIAEHAIDVPHQREHRATRQQCWRPRLAAPPRLLLTLSFCARDM